MKKLLNKINNKLIVFLAGKNSVMLNCTVKGGVVFPTGKALIAKNKFIN